MMRYAISGVNGNLVPVEQGNGGPVALTGNGKHVAEGALVSPCATSALPPDLPPHLPSLLRLNVNANHHHILSILWPILSVPDYSPLLAPSSPIVSSFIALLPPSPFRPPSSMPSKIKAIFTL